jgi:peptide/nickel transport system substrate-binding protein
VLQPVVVNRHLRNVPQEGVFSWEPGAQFGMYKPDGFWFDTGGDASASLQVPGN